MTTLAQHPLSAAFPSMSADDFAALVEDIRKHGQRDPILIYEGMVLDGWHRYQACTELGIKPKQFNFTDGDPVALVESVNLHRRHLSASQRAIAVVALKQWAPAGNPNVAAAATLPSTNDSMAKEGKVSPRSIRDAKVVHKGGLAGPVRDGLMTVEEAAKVVRGKTAPAPAAPKPAAKAPPPPAQEDFGPSDTEIAASQREQDEELAALRRVADSDDRLKTALDENKQLRAQVRVMQERINSLTNEKAMAIREAKRWQRKAEANDRAVA